MAQALETIKNMGDSIGSSLFRKDLVALVRGIRANKDNESKFISAALQEIKEELQSTDKEIKAMAVQKLTYLQMFGYDISWAAFRMIEVIAQPKFSHKRIGYLAAAQCFSETTDVMVLATNLIRKDCLSHQMYDAGIAINCLANICTTELARDLVPDIVSMVSSARPYTRKKAVLVLFKIFLKFPDALRPTFARLREKLEDPDPLSAAVNVVCELARKNAKNYLPLAPTLFKLLTTSTNNWMLIKIIKLFAVLCPLEERLAKKLADPLSNIINTTNAMSLLYESIQCCVIGLHMFPNVMRLCAAKLRMFVEHPDPNLKYLGLLALSKIMATFPRGILEHRDLILSCLEDEDTTIRTRALDLVVGMVEKKNLAFIIDKLKQYMEQAEGPYRSELLEKIIFICSQDKYKHISDFEWYLGILMDLTQYKQCGDYTSIRDQFIDVCVRVQVVRPVGVKCALALLQDAVLYTADATPSSVGMSAPLYAAAWIVGEYAEHCKELPFALELLTRPLHMILSLTAVQVLSLPASIQCIFVHAAIKVLAALAKNKTEEGDVALREALEQVSEALAPFVTAADLEVQERACFVKQVIELAQEGNDYSLLDELSVVFADPLNPVSAQAQSRVKPPEGLDLDQWIHEPLKAPEVDVNGFGVDEEDASWGGIGSGGYGSAMRASMGSSYTGGFGDDGQHNYSPARTLDEEAIKRKMAVRRAERAAAGDPYIIYDGEDEYDAPVRSLESVIDVPKDLRGPLVSSRGRGSPRGSPHGGRARGGRVQQQRPMQHVQLAEEENPEGWTPEDEAAKKASNPSRANDALANISLDDEADVNILQHQQHRTTQSPASSPAARSPARGGAAALARGGSPARGSRGGARGGRVKAAAPARAPRLYRPLVSNNAVVATYDCVPASDKKNVVLIKVGLVNRLAVPITRVVLHFKSAGDDLKPLLKGEPVAALSLPLTGLALAPSATPHFVKVPATFTKAAIASPASLNGRIVFRADGVEDDSEVDFTLTLTSSLLVSPAPIDANAFFHLLRTKATETKTGRLAGSLSAVISAITGYYSVRLVERDDQKASLYGRVALFGSEPTQQHHVAFLVKTDGEPGKIAVAVKSDSADLAASLVVELESVRAMMSANH